MVGGPVWPFPAALGYDFSEECHRDLFQAAHLRVCKTGSLCFLREPILKLHTGQDLIVTYRCFAPSISFVIYIYIFISYIYIIVCIKPQLNHFLCNMFVYCLYSLKGSFTTTPCLALFTIAGLGRPLSEYLQNG